tara:strand:+ start:398 stop:922 length:525 start_codon:yes stop_codon:yes gene_type:complete
MVYDQLMGVGDHLQAGNKETVMSAAQAQQETSLSHLLFGPPLTARIDPAEACAELDLALTTARAQLKAVFGPEENESANQVELETAAVSKLPRDAHGLIARRAMLLFAFREPEVAAAFDCELARDLQTRVLPFFAPRFLRNSAQNPQAFLVAAATLCTLYRGERLGNWPRALEA